MSIISRETRCLLSLSMLRGIGSAYLKKIIQIPNFINLTVEDLAKYSPEIEKALSDKKVWENCQGQVDFQLIQAEKNKARIISLLDPEYPKLLAETKDAPVILYVKGQLSKHSEKSVAIVGTRKPTSQGSEIANRITRFFVENGWSIVSGLAIGCDTRAHKTALSLGGHTVAVLAHGLDMVYPKENIPLAEEILASGGALISEYCFNQEVKNHQYVKRDQVQAGMAQGVVMIQSSLTGGSLHAPRASLSYNRWLAVPIPTKKDMQNLEDSIKANIVITDEDQSEKIKLLKCTQKQLEHIIVLKSKNDYYRMTEFSLKTKSELSNLSLKIL
ncbi:DNA-processing protein DprA [Gilliamella sp. BG4]|uniref:DNA-processing protein DprA n=2 Tax=unclassified Gilliamella TaxID=2685620 RepID=UPI0039861B0D